MMECNIYDKNLNRIAIIPTWISLLWEENYIDKSEFVIEVSYSKEFFGILSIGNYVVLSGHDAPMVIQAVEVTSTKIKASGVSARDYILGLRASNDQLNGENAEQKLYSMVGSMAEWPNLITAESRGLEDIYSADFSGGTILEYCIAVGELCDIGTRILYDKTQKKLVFECYKPPLNENLIFSTDYGNIQNLTYDTSVAKHKNVAMVVGSDRSDRPVVVESGETTLTGVSRREMYIEARSIRMEDGEALATYKQRLIDHGLSKLAECAIIQSIDFEIVAESVNLGDVVKCKIPELGYTAQVRISGIVEKSQKNKVTKSITLGTPVILGA